MSRYVTILGFTFNHVHVTLEKIVDSMKNREWIELIKFLPKLRPFGPGVF
jgi:hypothetical protein